MSHEMKRYESRNEIQPKCPMRSKEAINRSSSLSPPVPAKAFKKFETACHKTLYPSLPFIVLCLFHCTLLQSLHHPSSEQHGHLVCCWCRWLCVYLVPMPLNQLVSRHPLKSID